MRQVEFNGEPVKSASCSTAYCQAMNQAKESSYKCETFEDLIFACEPFDVLKSWDLFVGV